MKKIFTLILLLSFLSCDKDEPNTLRTKYSKEEIFNAVVGTWKFSRLGYDSEFKKIKNISYEECGRNNYTIFEQDSTITCIRDCGKDELVEKGTFYVEIGDSFSQNNVRLRTIGSGAILVPNIRHDNLLLYNFTDSTLIFSNVIYYLEDGNKENNLYSELKRVK